MKLTTWEREGQRSCVIATGLGSSSSGDRNPRDVGRGEAARYGGGGSGCTSQVRWKDENIGIRV